MKNHSDDCNRYYTTLNYSRLALVLVQHSSLLDKYAPVITKLSKRTCKPSLWFSSTLHALRSSIRYAANLYNALALLSPGHLLSLFATVTTTLYSRLTKQCYTNRISSVSDNPRRLWQTVNKLLCRKSASPLPTSTSFTSLADSCASFFTDKISKLRLSPL